MLNTLPRGETDKGQDTKREDSRHCMIGGCRQAVLQGSSGGEQATNRTVHDGDPTYIGDQVV